jgi:carboxypeptidase T
LDGEVQISFKGLSPHILQVPDPIQLNLNKFEPHLSNLSFTVDNLIGYGASVQLEVICQQGDYTFRDTLTKTRADFTTIFSDNGNDLSQWDNSNGQHWGTTNQTYKSGPVSITDSPTGDYLPNSQEALELKQSLDLTKATTAYAQFWAKWDIEDHYDYVVFQASTDGQNWENLCGEQSKLGSIFQLYEEPLYDGKQVRWVFETTDLSSYIGHLVHLRFFLFSDGFEERDGFYFDDFKVITINENNVGTKDIRPAAMEVYPNPAKQTFTFAIPDLQQPTLRIFNSVGELVFQSAVQANQSEQVNADSWPTGLYYYRLDANHSPVTSGAISLIR